MPAADQFRFSVVIPTYQRRDLAVAAVEALTRQRFADGFEVIVVVDGSADGSAEALRGLATPFPFLVVEQPNQGAASARNRGAAAARGEILLFLDDDMEADPLLLAEHDRSHREGAEVVLGHMPLHRESPPGVLSAGVGRWAETRLRDFGPSGRLPLNELLTGQISLRRAVFDRIGGFDTTFTHGGTFGNEDIDFGYRLVTGSFRIVFNPKAISNQKYVVGPRQHLRQWRQAGRADVAFARKHPEQAAWLFAHQGARTRRVRWLYRPVAAGARWTSPLIAGLRWLAIALVEGRVWDAFTKRVFSAVRAIEYWQGVREAGGIPGRRPLRVLAYHAVADLKGDPVLEPYGVPPDVFRRQLDTLRWLGFRFVAPGELVSLLGGRGGLPRRAVLLTFDDCFDDLLHTASPILAERAVPAVAFAVSGRLGGANDWDATIGATRLRLLDGDGLRRLAGQGIEIGAHSRTHPCLTRVTDEDLAAEVRGAVADLEAVGLERPRLFAYPYGESDPRVQGAARSAGLAAAFTVEPGRVRAGKDAFRLPRIEIMRHDVGWRFVLKVVSAGHVGTGGGRFRSVFRSGLRKSLNMIVRARAQGDDTKHKVAGS